MAHQLSHHTHQHATISHVCSSVHLYFALSFLQLRSSLNKQVDFFTHLRQTLTHYIHPYGERDARKITHTTYPLRCAPITISRLTPRPRRTNTTGRSNARACALSVPQTQRPVQPKRPVIGTSSLRRVRSHARTRPALHAARKFASASQSPGNSPSRSPAPSYKSRTCTSSPHQHTNERENERAE